MTWSIKLINLIKNDRANVAALVAIGITALVGFLGLAVDLGLVYATRSELQNAADASALAAAGVMITWDGDNRALAQPEAALSAARSYTSANEALGASLAMLDSDFTIGFWDHLIGNFDPDRTGPSSDPADLTAVKVTLRKDDQANAPISTFFARILGIDQVSLDATSTAFLGWAGEVPAGTVDLPIGVKSSALQGGGGEPNCGTWLGFRNQSNQNGSWTTFFTWPANDINVRKYVNQTYETPPLKVGDVINMTNGVLSSQTFDQLMNRFEQEGEDLDGDGDVDEWLVLLPVVEHPHCSCTGTVVGFAHMVITEVRPAPYKDLTGYLSCEFVVPGSPTGGGNFGVRATSPVLIN